MDSNILMESGTNELEILEFMIDDHCYGINVAKIKEIITFQEVTPVPNAHPSIEGIFMPRDAMITAIRTRRPVYHHQLQQTGYRVSCRFRYGNPPFQLGGHHQTGRYHVNRGKERHDRYHQI